MGNKISSSKPRHSPAAGNGPIRKLIENVWFVEVRYPLNLLIGLRKTMTIVKDGDDLWLFNCARLDEETEAELEKLGKVAHIVSMSSHSHHDAYFQERFQATLWTIQGLEYQHQDNVQYTTFTKDTTFPLDGGVKPLFLYTEEEEGGENAQKQQHPLFNEAVVYLPKRRLLIACDIIQNEFRQDDFSPDFDQGRGGRTVNKLLRLQNVEMFVPPMLPGMLSPSGGFGALKSYLYSLAELDFDVCITGHAAPCTENPRAKWKAFLDSVDWEHNKVTLKPRITATAE